MVCAKRILLKVNWSTFGYLAKKESSQISVYEPFSRLKLAEGVGFEPTMRLPP